MLKAKCDNCKVDVDVSSTPVGVHIQNYKKVESCTKKIKSDLGVWA